MVYKGTVEGFEGITSSGIGYLTVNGLPIICEASSTIRALGDVFGDDGFENRDIVFSLDDLGVLATISPEEDYQGDAVDYEGDDITGFGIF